MHRKDTTCKNRHCSYCDKDDLKPASINSQRTNSMNNEINLKSNFNRAVQDVREYNKEFNLAMKNNKISSSSRDRPISKYRTIR